ncbi:hypothetical protein BAE44_0009893 [Dichanthelium oligosanthes]|uniref:Uncharacterized protein n=1 Tax=Dichanthelium oligosanthes TaxID=888268 RepID=A0A1E5VVE6_9POAL|nr:hypothetical protein BAE44_0009893 [Dichanthelium oligosanthes]
MVVVAWGCCFLLAAFARALRWLVQLPALLCCEAMVWAVSFLAFPLRMLTAVERERKLGRLIGEMQVQMDDLVWENKQLEEKVQAALREQEAMDALLDEMEDEHDDAFARIDALEAQLKALRQENMRLNEHKGKSMWDKAPARHGNDDVNTKASESEKKPAARSPREASSGRERGEEEEAVAGTQEDAALKLKSADPASVLALTTTAPAADEQQAKVAARRRSLFSLGMSLAVGAVAWSADAPCLPLLAGLFAVVGVSMRSVSRLRRGGPAADAVALLSLNWFLLGALTSPMLPGVAHAVVPRAGRVLGPALAWFAAAMPIPCD